ncbi:MAG: tyrosine-protein phosphatase [Acidimicrobiales bacterium]
MADARRLGDPPRGRVPLRPAQPADRQRSRDLRRARHRHRDRLPLPGRGGRRPVATVVRGRQPHRDPHGGEAGAGEVVPRASLRRRDGGINDDWVFETYVDMLEAHADGFATAIRHVANDGPSLFHCTAGKDRTGIMAMLLLSIANVDRERILDDLELSNPTGPSLDGGTRRSLPSAVSTSRTSAQRSGTTTGHGEDPHLARRDPRRATGYLRSEAGLTDAELGRRSLLVAD